MDDNLSSHLHSSACLCRHQSLLSIIQFFIHACINPTIPPPTIHPAIHPSTLPSMNPPICLAVYPSIHQSPLILLQKTFLQTFLFLTSIIPPFPISYSFPSLSSDQRSIRACDQTSQVSSPSRRLLSVRRYIQVHAQSYRQRRSPLRLSFGLFRPLS